MDLGIIFDRIDILPKILSPASRKNHALDWLIFIELLLIFPLFFIKPFISKLTSVPKELNMLEDSSLLYYMAIAVFPIMMLSLISSIYLSYFIIKNGSIDKPCTPDKITSLKMICYSTGSLAHLAYQLFSVFFLSSVLALTVEKLDLLDLLKYSKGAIEIIYMQSPCLLGSVSISFAFIGSLFATKQACDHCLRLSATKIVNEASRAANMDTDR